MVSKEEVIRIVGEDVFAWGLLIGDEDADRLTDETKHILVTFAHRSIQEFFGAFYLILSLSEGEAIVSLLCGDCEEPIFLTNPLFLEFCLWLMNSTEVTSFPLEVEKVREPLVTYIGGKIDKEYLDLKRLSEDFPALDITTGSYSGHYVTDGNPMVLDLMQKVLSRCSKIEHLCIPISWPFDELLSAVNRCLWDSQIHILCLVRNVSGHYERPKQREREILIHLVHLEKPFEMLHVALKYCYRAERRPCIRVDVASDFRLKLSELFQISDIRQVHVDCGVKGAHVSFTEDIPPCPSLRQLSVKYLKKGDDVFPAFCKAIQNGHLPNLNYLGFPSCFLKTEGILRHLFPSGSPRLEHLDLERVKLNKSDLQFISELKKL